jgi:hypothetical protein
VATFAEAGALAEDPAFVRRVTVALMLAGGTVAIEDRTQYTDSQIFAQRKTLAINVLQDPPAWARRFAWIVQYDARVRASAPSPDNPTPDPVPDEVLAALIYWVWNAVAGAGPASIPPPGDEPVVAAPAERASVFGATVLAGSPAGAPTGVAVEGGGELVQPRRPVLPPGMPQGWPGRSPWEASEEER